MNRMPLFITFVIGILLVFLFFGLIKWTDSNLEWMISELGDKSIEESEISDWVSTAVVITSGGLCVPFNIVCEILKVAL
jgi:hypothetical protein